MRTWAQLNRATEPRRTSVSFRAFLTGDKQDVVVWISAASGARVPYAAQHTDIVRKS